MSELSKPDSPITCGGCGCWCDDIRVRAQQDGGPWSNACDLGQRYLAAKQAEPIASRLEQSGSDWRTKAGAIAQRLFQAKRPLILGLQHNTIESQRHILGVADRASAAIDILQSTNERAKILSFQNAGSISCSWGEVKNRAQVIVYWRCDPDTAPRFRERYGDLADGYFIHSDRRVFVVGDAKLLAAWPDNVTKIEATADDQFLFQQLRLWENDSHQTKPPAKQTAGYHKWISLIDAIKQAKFSAFVCAKLQVSSTEAEGDKNDANVEYYSAGISPANSPPKPSLVLEAEAAHQALYRLVRGLNQDRRCVVVPWPAAVGDNTAGAQAVMTWRSGYPMSIDYALDYPCYDPVSGTWQEILHHAQCDYVLVVGATNKSLYPWPTSDSAAMPSDALRNDVQAALQQFLNHVPQATVDEIGEEAISAAPDHFIAAQTWAPDEHVMRADGVIVPLRTSPIRTSETRSQNSSLHSILYQGDVLKFLLHRCQELRLSGAESTLGT